ncbi:X-type DNA polymerase [Cryptosporidium canis]|uniref:DNA polymerase eta n=1 Tax=Cryptosporidium canis TaxID=195482 RepID=A0ABQ8P9E1_9CRYT|nr:X-type DNA polymerase [Cryptosporidium canis]
MLNIEEYNASGSTRVLFEDVGADFIDKYDHKMVPRVVALVDMDAFFAQVCHVEYDIPRDKPLAVIHNQTVLAVNYPSRERGVSRSMSKEEILSKCPDIVIPQNVFVDVRGQLLDLPDDETNYQKLSLDIFRRASRMVFSKLKGYLPTCKYQIASIDEIYFDLTDLIRKIFHIVKEIISGQKDYHFHELDQLKSELCTSTACSDILPFGKVNDSYQFGGSNFSALIMNLFPELNDESTMSNILDILYPETNQEVNAQVATSSYRLGISNVTFHEMCLIIGAIIIYRARNKLREETSYTCSSGIFVNKIYSKMVCSINKPNGQSVLLNRWFEAYIRDTHILKLRLLGGKLGQSLVERYPEIKCIKDLQKLPLKQLMDDFGERTGQYLFNSSRGIDHDPVNNNSENSSSLQSSKVFGTPLNSSDQIQNWLRIFSGELFFRNKNNHQVSKRRPTKITVRVKSKDGTIKARTGDLIYDSDIPSRNNIFESAKNIIREKFDNSLLFPCRLLGISLCGYKKCTGMDKMSKLEFNVANKYQMGNKESDILDRFNVSSNSLINSNLYDTENSRDCETKDAHQSFLTSWSENEYFRLDDFLIDAIDNEIFGDQVNSDIGSETIGSSSELSKFIYKGWPFVKGKEFGCKRPRVPNSSNKVLKTRANSESSIKFSRQNNPKCLQTKYKQTKLEFVASSTEIPSPTRILIATP